VGRRWPSCLCEHFNTGQEIMPQGDTKKRGKNGLSGKKQKQLRRILTNRQRTRSLKRGVIPFEKWGKGRGKLTTQKDLGAGVGCVRRVNQGGGRGVGRVSVRGDRGWNAVAVCVGVQSCRWVPKVGKCVRVVWRNGPCKQWVRAGEIQPNRQEDMFKKVKEKPAQVPKGEARNSRSCLTQTGQPKGVENFL